MRIALLAALPAPRPWAPGADHDRIGVLLEQAAVADAAGFRALWVPEHHFREEGSHAAVPAMLLAAVAARAPRLELGLGPVPLQARIAPPVRLAEELATLDALSGGRARLAVRTTLDGTEAGGHGPGIATPTEAEVEEHLDVLARLLAETPFAGWDGPGIRLPARQLLPRAVQEPHPPLWLAGDRPEVVRRAAELGLGALVTAPLDPERLAPWVAEHRDVLRSERAVPAGFAVEARVAVVLPAFVHADEEEALRRGGPGLRRDRFAAAHFGTFGQHRPGAARLDDELAARGDRAGLGDDVLRAHGGRLEPEEERDGRRAPRGAIGTPAQVVELLERYERAGLDEVVLHVATGGTDHDDVLACLELLGREVLPAFAARAEAADAAREAELADAVEASLARRAPLRTHPVDAAVGPVPGTDLPPLAPREGLDEDDVAARPAGGPSAVPGPEAGAAALEAGGVAAQVGVGAAPPLTPSAPPAPTPAAAPGRAGAPAQPAAWRRVLEERGEAAFRAFVRRADDARLERTAGSDRGLRLLFGAMEAQFGPERAGGFSGELVYELRGSDGRTRLWTLEVGPQGAHARPGPAADPRLTVRLALADFVRVAARDLDPGAALLSGRMDLEGDFSLAARLGGMFGGG